MKTTMTPYLARVRNGRLADVPTDLPEGSEVELIAAGIDDLSDLDEAQKKQLAEDIRVGDEDASAGRIEDADAFLRSLRKR